MKKCANYQVLIEAAERYVNHSKYPTVEDLCSILGIEFENQKKDEEDV